MKILVCESCLDWVKLCSVPRRCRCGASAGVYQADDVTVAVRGPCFVVGISNAEFPQHREGRWTVLNEPHEHIRREQKIGMEGVG